MIDRLFLATLTFCLLTGGTLAIVSESVADRRPLRVVQLEPVVVTAKRLAPQATVAEVERVEPASRLAQ